MEQNYNQIDINNSILLEIIDIQNEVVQAGLNLEQISFLVAKRAQQLVDAVGAAIELKEGNDMVYRATSGLADNQLGLRLDFNTSLSGLCVKEAKIQICNDSEIDPRVNREACRRVGLRSMIVFPLIYKDEAIGVLKIMSDKPNFFTKEHQNIVSMLTKIISAALYTAGRLGENELYLASITDKMTGIKNRSFFYDILRTTFISAKELKRKFTLFIIDMDGLKKINDTYGHKYGDDSIKELVHRVKKVLRSDDIFCRLGGDEFGVIFNNINDNQEAQILQKRVSEAIKKDFFINEIKIELDASIGFKVLDDDVLDIQELINIADKNMYKNKKEHQSNKI